jgi:eukaryotic-like serine/threonine-protein kinase
MTRDLSLRLDELSAVLASRLPGVLDATIVLLESVPPALDAARSGRYEVQRPIGAGGHSEVLLAVVQGADGFRRPVAIKRVRSDLANQRPFVAMLIEEAHQTALLSHPNVVSVLDFDRDAQRRPYLVMEYVDGVDLGMLIETGPVPHSVAIFIVRELLAGLGYIHELRDQGRGRVGGLIHRDIKPSNVLLSWEGAVKLADFGLAQMLQRIGPVGPHAIEGTRGYMSPEQAGREDLDGRSDLYAVGIVLWEFLAAQRLRVGLAGDDRAATSFHAIRPPSEHRQGVPADLEAVAMRLLAYDREERYRTAELAAHDLLCCQDAPRDGRDELARLLTERFPRSHRPDPLRCPPKLGPSTRPQDRSKPLDADEHAAPASTEGAGRCSTPRRHDGARAPAAVGARVQCAACGCTRGGDRASRAR